MRRYGEEPATEDRERRPPAGARRHRRLRPALMADVGLTNGAFCAQFASKADLLAGVVQEILFTMTIGTFPALVRGDRSRPLGRVPRPWRRRALTVLGVEHIADCRPNQPPGEQR